MITEIRITSERTDGIDEAREEVNNVISRVMSAAMKVNPPGEWECVHQRESEPIEGVEGTSVTEQVFRFVPNDNAAEQEEPAHAEA